MSEAFTVETRLAEEDPWQVAFSDAPALGNAWFSRSLDGREARHVRVTVTGASSSGAVQARELEVLGAPVGADAGPTGLPDASAPLDAAMPPGRDGALDRFDAGVDAGTGSPSDGGCGVASGRRGRLGVVPFAFVGALIVARRRRRTR